MWWENRLLLLLLDFGGLFSLYRTLFRDFLFNFFRRVVAFAEIFVYFDFLMVELKNFLVRTCLTCFRKKFLFHIFDPTFFGRSWSYNRIHVISCSFNFDWSSDFYLNFNFRFYFFLFFFNLSFIHLKVLLLFYNVKTQLFQAFFDRSWPNLLFFLHRFNYLLLLFNFNFIFYFSINWFLFNLNFLKFLWAQFW